MCNDHSDVIWKLMTLIEDGEEIPYALERQASSLKINIQRLREVMKDVDEKTAKLAASESSETRVHDPEEDWFDYPEAYS